MTTAGSIRARPFDDAVKAEVDRVHPKYVCTEIPVEWDLLSAPEPCERCGTRVFALRDSKGTVALFHVGWIKAKGDACSAVMHTPERCSAARRSEVRLEGRKPAEIQWLLNPPRNAANPAQMGLFGEVVS